MTGGTNRTLERLLKLGTLRQGYVLKRKDVGLFLDYYRYGKVTCGDIGKRIWLRDGRLFMEEKKNGLT